MADIKEEKEKGGKMRVNLEVPYEERKEAQNLGAKWDVARKVWYVVDADNLEQFLRWIPDHLKKPHKPRG